MLEYIPNPTTNNAKTSDGPGSGSFPSSLTGLLPNTTYYIRAYAINSAQTSYGNTLSFKTQPTPVVTLFDGHEYSTISIGNQVWMTENLQTTHYQNGDPIITGLANNEWSSTTSGAYAIYNNDPANIDSYGLLYNWYAVTDNRNICPEGWHVPSNNEWAILANYLIANGYGFGGNGVDIGKAMAAISGWNASTITGTVGNDQPGNNKVDFQQYLPVSVIRMALMVMQVYMDSGGPHLNLQPDQLMHFSVFCNMLLTILEIIPTTSIKVSL